MTMESTTKTAVKIKQKQGHWIAFGVRILEQQHMYLMLQFSLAG